MAAEESGPLRLVLLGSGAAFTSAVLRGLLAGGLRPAGIVLEGSPAPPPAPHALPVHVAGSLAAVAHAEGIAPQIVADVNAAPGVATLSALAADVLLVACLPRRLAPAPLASARLGVLNVHPSLLPAYRGPTPVFWQLRAGAGRAGVSLHHVTRHLDGGPVVAQAALATVPGERAGDLERRLAHAGGRLAAALLASAPLPAGVAQDETAATYGGLPGPEALEIDPSWGARRAWRFMAAIGGDGVRFRLRLGHVELELDRALDHRGGDAGLRVDGTLLHVPMSPGVLVARGRVMRPTGPPG